MKCAFGHEYPDIFVSLVPTQETMLHDTQNIDLGGSARSPEDVLALHDLGMQFAELAVPDRLSQGLDVFIEMKERLGMYYLCHGPLEGDPNDTRGLSEIYLPKILLAFSQMKQLQASLLTIHFWLDGRYVREEVLSEKLDILREIVARAGEAGVVVCLENLSESAAHLQAAMDALPGLQLTLDLGHAQLLTEVNRSDEILAQFPDRIGHVHLHDNRGGDSHRDDLHLPIGDGIIDFERPLRKLRELGYGRTLTLELKPHEIAASLPRVKAMLGMDT
jgi:sugar phosphate isomerase/epimerase